MMPSQAVSTGMVSVGMAEICSHKRPMLLANSTFLPSPCMKREMPREKESADSLRFVS